MFDTSEPDSALARVLSWPAPKATQRLLTRIMRRIWDWETSTEWHYERVEITLVDRFLEKDKAPWQMWLVDTKGVSWDSVELDDQDMQFLAKVFGLDEVDNVRITFFVNNLAKLSYPDSVRAINNLILKRYQPLLHQMEVETSPYSTNPDYGAF